MERYFFKKHFIAGGLILASVLLFIIFAAKINAEVKNSIESENYSLSLTSGKDFYRLDELPEFQYEFSKKRNMIMALFAFFRNLISDEYRDIIIKAELAEPGGGGRHFSLEAEYLKRGKFDIILPIDKAALRPGKYALSIEVVYPQNFEEQLILKHDFSWGVLSFNSNKSIYLPGEEAFLQMAVLDDGGDTLCDAKLLLEITDPNGKIEVLSTENGSIEKNPDCGANNVISFPDYYAHHLLANRGIYEIKLTAFTQNGSNSLFDRIEVKQGSAFEIERIGPTRINPRASYEMLLRVKANLDYAGFFSEFVPNSFDIVDWGGSGHRHDPASPMKELFWPVDIKAGQSIELAYVFDAPDITPLAYLLGQAKIGDFSEARYWQIASDAVGLYGYNSGVGPGWNTPDNAWDNTNNTYADRGIPGSGVDDSAFSLIANANTSTPIGGKITAVELGVEGYVQSTNVNAVVRPLFNNGASTGTPQNFILDTADNNIIVYNPITSDASGPGADNWTWDDLKNLDVMLYGTNSGVPTKSLYIDQIYVRATFDYSPTALINSVQQKRDGSGILDFSVDFNDAEGAANIRASIEYATGTVCDFLSSGQAWIDPAVASISADWGTPRVDNEQPYQVGTSTGWITAASGANTVEFDWLSKQDLPEADGEYCVQITANDLLSDQAEPATSTVVIDNKNPTSPGALAFQSSTANSITLILGASTTESHFREYKLYYKLFDGLPVAETDSFVGSSTDLSLGYQNFNLATTTKINGLAASSTYSFALFAYDLYGNKSSSTQLEATTTLYASWREEEDTPDPTAGHPITKTKPLRLRLSIVNEGEWDASNYNFQLEYASKQGECATTTGWLNVPVNAADEHFEMYNSEYIENGATTTQRMKNLESYPYVPGFLVENPFNISEDISIASNKYTELEFAIRPTADSIADNTYCFRVVNSGVVVGSYDIYPELTVAPPVSGIYNSAALRNDGTGRVDISIEVEDIGMRECFARIIYAAGSSCDLGLAAPAQLDESPVSVQADFGSPSIDNSSYYQIGTSTAAILTAYGSNTLNFDWLSDSDLPGIEGDYCLGLVVNDGFDDQAVPATTTLIVDNKNPSAPGPLTELAKVPSGVTLSFGATSSDMNFREYKIYYKQGSAGVTELDLAFSSSSDSNLGHFDFNEATTTTIYGLEENKIYYFNIWAYDNFGNKASSAKELIVKNVPEIKGTLYQDEGLTPLLSGVKVSIAAGGSYIESATSSGADGSFVFSGVDPPATGTPILVYIDDSSEKGATYYRYPGLSEINGLDIYLNRIILRHGDSGPVNIGDLDSYDQDQDSDIGISVNGASLSVESGFELYIWPGSDFDVGGAELSIDDLKIMGDFLAVGTQTISIAGSWNASGGSFSAASSTVRFFSDQAGNTILANGSPFFNLLFDGLGDWTLLDTASTSATTTIKQGTFKQGGNSHFQTESLVIYGGAAFSKATGTGLFIFEGPRDGNYEDLNAVKNNLGNVQIGYSPARTNLNSDFTADSLTINAGDSFNTRGFEVDVTNYISIFGEYNCFADKETDGTITTLGTDWTLDPAGTFIADNSTTTFAGSASSTLDSGGTDPNHDFFNLTFEKISLATTTIAGNAIRASGHIVIGSNSVFDVSASNYGISAGGSWTNNGWFLARQATTTFDSAFTSNTINAGDSPFYNVIFDNPAGGWAVIADATSSKNWQLANAADFNVNSTVTIEVGGEFKYDLSEASSTWTGSTLYLNSSNDYQLIPKGNDGPNFGNLIIGQNANITMWNSSADSALALASSSLYSMDHNDSDGSLYIWGEYRNSGNEYWSYGTDFDGTDLTGSERQCNVRIAGNSLTLFSVANVEILGSPSASTTIENQGSGNYSISIEGGSLNAQYYSIKNMDENGFNLSGSLNINSLNNGEYELSADGGSLIALTASVIDANPAATTTGCSFATSTSALSGFNVKLAGTPSSGWLFTGYSGGLSGEDYDSDPGDPRGFIAWDDSPIFHPASQNWKWFHDQNNETPAELAAPMNFAPPSIARGNIIKLRITINELDGIVGENVKMRLQFSTFPDFSDDLHFVGEVGSSTALWAYANGAGEDNAVISSTTLPDAIEFGTHNESGVTLSDYNHATSTSAEYEFTIKNNNAATGTVYYFRAYSNFYSIYRYYELAVLKNSGGYSYPSINAGESYVSIGISGLPQGTITEGVNTDINTSAQSVPFGTLQFGQPLEAAQRFEVTTNAESGYRLYVKQDSNLISSNGSIINPITYPNENPGNWPISSNPSDFGYHSGDFSLSGIDPARFLLDDKYAKFENLPKEIGYSPTPIISDIFDLIYKINVSNNQESGDYTNQIVYIIIPYY